MTTRRSSPVPRAGRRRQARRRQGAGGRAGRARRRADPPRVRHDVHVGQPDLVPAAAPQVLGRRRDGGGGRGRGRGRRRRARRAARAADNPRLAGESPFVANPFAPVLAAMLRWRMPPPLARLSRLSATSAHRPPRPTAPHRALAPPSFRGRGAALAHAPPLPSLARASHPSRATPIVPPCSRHPLVPPCSSSSSRRWRACRLGRCSRRCSVRQDGQSDLLGKGISGHHGLLRPRSKARGCSTHSGGGA